MATNKTPHTKQPHPYADVIKAWADGAEVQWNNKYSGQWIDELNPSFIRNYDWRIKPVEPDLLELDALELEDIPSYFEQFKVICKWVVEGKVIQFREKGTDDDWQDDIWPGQNIDEVHFNFRLYEFRSKPNTKTIKYQNYKTKYASNDVCIYAWCSTDPNPKCDLEKLCDFIEWIGEEQSITIEVEDEY